MHGLVTDKSELRARVESLLVRCGMPKSAADRYPHEFSGGQRQRIGIARALALEPEFIVCDEPTSALDVSIQAQIINLLSDLQSEFGLSYLFISHDMAVIQHVCKRIAVMYKGKIVEEGAREQILGAPAHKYTQSLLSAVPEPDPRRKKQRVVFEGGAMSRVGGGREIDIRSATRADVPLILRFVRELAEYERAPDAVKATEVLIEQNLFGSGHGGGPVAECLIGEIDGTPQGFAVFFTNFSTWLGRPGIYLEDLFVRPDARGGGVGRALFATVARLAVERGCGRMEWAVLDWNEPAIGFYKKLGAVAMDEWTTYRLAGDALARAGAERVVTSSKFTSTSGRPTSPG